MKYFKIEKSLDPKVVGIPSNHSEEMSKGYDFNAPNSVYNWRKNSLVPNLKSVLVNKNAKITDFIDCVPIGGSGAILSEKFFNVLSWFNILDYTLADIELIQFNKVVPGFLFFYFNRTIQDNDIEFSKTKYVNIEFNYEIGEYKELEDINISSLTELDEGRPVSQLRPVLKRLTLKKDFKFDVFCLISPGRLIVSEAVKNALVREKITGIRFEPFVELVRE